MQSFRLLMLFAKHSGFELGLHDKSFKAVANKFNWINFEAFSSQHYGRASVFGIALERMSIE